MGPFCYSGVKINQGEGGRDGIGEWHAESPVSGLASFMETFSGTLVSEEDFGALLGHSERTGTGVLP